MTTISRRRNRLIPYGNNYQIGKLTYTEADGTVKNYATYYLHSAIGAYWVSKGKCFESCLDEIHKPPFHAGGPFDLFRRNSRGLKVIGPVVIERFVPHTYYPRTWRYEGGFVTKVVPNTSIWWNGECFQYNKPHYDVSPTYRFGGEAVISGLDATDQLFRIKPGVSLGQFIGEFSDVPHMLRSRCRKFARSYQRFLKGIRSPRLRDRYLNRTAKSWLEANFGWLPLVSDIRDFYNTYHNHSKTIRDLRKWNGKFRHRRRILLDQREEGVVNSSANTWHYPTGLPNITNGLNPGSGTARLYTIERAWVEGSFRYWIPDINSDGWHRKAVRYLFGLDPSPALLWELTPFSWLVDWYFNVGKMIEDAGGPGLQENLAAKYVYTMHQKDCVLAIDSTENFLGNPSSHSGRWYFSLTRKVRMEGAHQPFLTSGDLTARQYSILAALGISKYVKKL